MKNSKFLKAITSILVYLFIFSVVPVKNIVKAETNSPKTISGFESLYEIQASQIQGTTAIVTTTTNMAYSGNLRVILKNENNSKNVDLNIDSRNVCPMGEYNNNLYFYDKNNRLIYTIDVKNASVSGETKLPATLSSYNLSYCEPLIDKDGAIWIYRASDSSGNRCIIKIVNNDCKVILNKIQIRFPLSPSFFEAYDNMIYKIGKIDGNNNINLYNFINDYYAVRIDNANGIWMYNSGAIEKFTINANNELVSVRKYAVDSNLGYYEPSFDKNNNLWINCFELGKIYELVNDNFIEKYNYSVSKDKMYSFLNIYDENNFVLGTPMEGYLRYSVNSVDLLYQKAYEAVVSATSNKTQKSINEARSAIEALWGTGAEWAIGEFSKNVDQIQQPFLVNICNAISAAKANPTQANINTARATLDPELPAVWRSSYSSAVDVIQQGLMKRVVEAVDKAVATKAKADIDAANKLIEDVKTAIDPAIAAWAVEMQKKLPIL